MKPQPKRELAIDRVFERDWVICFYASPDALEDVKGFGRIEPWETGSSRYWLYVNKMYDFNEIVEYMRNYEKD